MKKILITGGTVFVSKFLAGYFSDEGYEVFVLNRGSRDQVPGVTLIRADRHGIKDMLKGIRFDCVIDVTAYDSDDINDLLPALDEFGQYVMISSSAVYPETETQPFKEDASLGENIIWGRYGTDKIAAEKALTAKVPDAYILRPPYLYGPMNNVYREAFVFDCAIQGRKFFLPGNGGMKLQFFHVRDLCRMIQKIIETKPSCHIFNCGNTEAVTVREWALLCYEAAGRTPEFVSVPKGIPQRSYFSFYDYEYFLDVTRQNEILDHLTDLKEGLAECFEWYETNSDEVKKKPLLEYIDEDLYNMGIR